MDLEKLMQDKDNILNVDNQTILNRGIYEQIIVKAIVILLTELKMKSMEVNELSHQSMMSDDENEIANVRTKIDELERLEEIYRNFEDNLDAAEKDEEMKDELRTLAIKILKAHT